MSPVPAKARVFISHSAKEPEARAVQDALVAALQAPEWAERFGILLDRVTLEPGDMWRSRINLWVGGCDAAVILLSKAALESAYVAYEASILSYRRGTRETVAVGCEMKDSLLLLPVLLEDVTVEDLRKGRLSPAQLAELQVVQGKGKTAEEIAAEVIARLEKDVQPGTTPLERRAQHLANLLRDRFKANQLVAAAKKVDLDVDRWIPFVEEKLPLRLAIQLLSVGMQAAVPALLDLRACIPDKTARADWVEKMVQHIASSWVDPCSIDRLPLIAKGDKPLAVGVNACDPLTAKMYVLCASCGDPEDTWRPTECDGIVGEDRIEKVIEKLSDKLGRVLALCLDCAPGEVLQELKALNSIERQPVVVALPGAGISDEILEALRGRFPYVTFFLLLGNILEAGPRLSEKTLEILFPALAAGDEDLFLDGYRNFRATVRVR